MIDKISDVVTDAAALFDPEATAEIRSRGRLGVYRGRQRRPHPELHRRERRLLHPGQRAVGVRRHGRHVRQVRRDATKSWDENTVDYRHYRGRMDVRWAHLPPRAGSSHRGRHRRYPPTFPNHVHMISLGYGDAPVGIYIPGQVDDYHEHKTGLVGHAYDPTWHPVDINATVFSYPDYIRSQEDDMPTVQDLLDAKINSDADVRAALRAAVRTDANVGRLLNLLPKINGGFRDIHKALDDLSNQAKNDATKQAVANVRSRVALAEQTIVEQLGGIGKEDNA
jgi:hypothetical protein